MRVKVVPQHCGGNGVTLIPGMPGFWKRSILPWKGVGFGDDEVTVVHAAPVAGVITTFQHKLVVSGPGTFGELYQGF